jgi:phosphatidylglycerophosphate synthase
MATTDREPVAPASGVSGTRAVVGDIVAALVPTLGGLGATWWLLGLPASYLAVGLAVYGALAGIILRGAPPGLPGPGLGLANRVTLARAALSVPVLALSLHPSELGVGGAWWVIVLSTVVMVMDGFDGRIARRTGSQSSFGARFDMELDAALIMALALLVWRDGRVGGWVLLIGAMRYAFVIAGMLEPALTRELPPSLRRKVVCVVQGVVLLVALGPVIPAWLAVAATAAGLTALIYSFAVDVHWALVTADAPAA